MAIRQHDPAGELSGLLGMSPLFTEIFFADDPIKILNPRRGYSDGKFDLSSCDVVLFQPSAVDSARRLIE